MKTLEQLADNLLDQIEALQPVDYPHRTRERILITLKEAQAMVYEDMKKAASPVTENEKEDEFYRRAEEDLKNGIKNKNG